jgi:hypothetical protein
MATDACRVVTTRVSSPPPGEAVLALSFHWGERLVSLEHLAVGERAKGAVGGGTPAVSWDGTTPRLTVPDELDAVVRADEALEVPLRSGLTLRARLRRREAAPAAGEFSGEDLLFFRVMAFATLGFLAAVAMMEVTPVVGGDASSHFFDRRPIGPSAHFVVTHPAHFVVPRPVHLVVPRPLPNHVFDAVPAIVPGRGGSRGDTTPRRKHVASAVDATPSDKRAKVNDVLRQMMGSGPALNVATADFGSELDAALDLLSGPTTTDRLDDLGGLGSRGNGPGAGTADLGIGGVGTVGGALGTGSSGLRSHEQPSWIIWICEVAVTGYSREEVLRVVKRHESEIRFCYESALRKHQELPGIAPTGDVEMAEIAESSRGDPAAEACIFERVKRWRFPQPEGEEVVVTFPWVFKVAGSGEADEVP